MKKLFYFAVMLFAVAACDNENEVSEVLDPIQQMQIELITNANDQVQKILDEYGDYDRSAAASLLTNTVFKYSGYVEYDEGWSEIIAPGDAFGEISLEGGYRDWYRFEEDGTLAYRLHTCLTPEGEYFATGTWSFDPETNQLSISIVGNPPAFTQDGITTQYTVRALGEKVLLLDEMKRNPGNKALRYFRRLYIVE